MAIDKKSVMKQEPRRFFDKRENTTKVLWIFHALCAALLVIDMFYHRHTMHAWEDMWGFYAIYGFVACVVLVLVAKQLRKLVMVSERYYGDG
jgi:hypothetical protein